jgi:cobyrinic acid a,c-diamide synthase
MRHLGGTLGVPVVAVVDDAPGVQRSADAITVGFAAAAATFALALLCGHRLLTRTRVTDAPASSVSA